MVDGLPFMAFYCRDFFADERVRAMSGPARALYALLLIQNWLEGSIPEDPDFLAALMDYPADRFRELWPEIQPCFQPANLEGRLTNRRIERDMQGARDRHRRLSEAGRRGGIKSRVRAATHNGASREPEATPKPGLSHPEAYTDADADAETHSDVFGEPVREVFEVCRELRDSRIGKKKGPRFQLTKARAGKIRARLREGFTVDELMDCARGFYADTWPDRDKYLDPVYAFKSDETVRRFGEQYRNGSHRGARPQYQPRQGPGEVRT
jgi:uncharacterized protein YdaU (DUF1376 family)